MSLKRKYEYVPDTIDDDITQCDSQESLDMAESQRWDSMAVNIGDKETTTERDTQTTSSSFSSSSTQTNFTAIDEEKNTLANNAFGALVGHELEGGCEAAGEAEARLRRGKLLRRQGRLPDDREPRRQASEPAPCCSQPTLQKHESYPQYNKIKRGKPHEQEVGSLLIRAVTVIDRAGSAGGSGAGSGAGSVAGSGAGSGAGEGPARASHTPAVRSGPPLSCNFCWNTVDDCGRILRRKTQYHCPECRTNLCIVPCFHQYHDNTCLVKPEPITCKPSILDH